MISTNVSETKGNFDGFVFPEENWFRLPNNWTNITAEMTSMSEIKVVEYVLRHTWGWMGQHDKYQHITTDEFEFGRKQANGERIDKGTGLSNHSIYLGLKKAVEHGFLKVIVNNRDLGRVKKLYCLNMKRSVETTEAVRRNDGPYVIDKEKVKKITLSELKDSDKKCLSSNNKTPGTKEIQPLGNKRKKTDPSKFDIVAGKHLIEAVKKVETIRKSSKPELWCHDIRKMRQIDDVSEKDIKTVLLWYKKHIGEEYIPEAQCGKTFRSKFPKLERAMQRSIKPQKEVWHNKEEEYQDPKTNKWHNRETLIKLRSAYFKKYPKDVRIEQKRLDIILLEKGMVAGQISNRAVTSG